jgi:rod shape-determining protein MreC
MALVDIRQRSGLLFGLLTVAHIILVSTQLGPARGGSLAEAVVFGAFAEVQRGATAALGRVNGAWGNYLALRAVRSENKVLHSEIGRLQVTLQQEQALAAQARTLQNLLELQQSTPLQTMAAVLIGGGASPDFRTVSIDKGTRHGLRQDLAVMAPAGVVGRIILPSIRASKIQLLIDRNAAAGVLIERSRAQGIIVGNGSDRLHMDFVVSDADLLVGDRVVTSGIDGIYPKGLVVGQIESFGREAGAYQDVVVRPTVVFSTLEAVLVVLTSVTASE